MTPQILKLTEPVQAHGREVTELTFRKPVAKDLRAFDKGGEIAGTIEFVASLTGQPVSTIESLCVSDFQACGKVVEGFLGDGHATGKKG
jgi:hypothetical protein